MKLVMKALPTAAALVLMAPAGIALAKGVAGATISGPGAGGGITLDGDDAQRLMTQTGVFAADPVTDADRPPGDEAALGPRYVVTYEFQFPVARGTEKSVSIVQHLYPYATGGPLTFTPRQDTPMQPLGPTWDRGTNVMLQNLVQYGLPEEAPESPSAEAGDGSMVPWFVLGAIAALLAVAAVSARFLRLHPSPTQ
jgi:hypothetical protein